MPVASRPSYSLKAPEATSISSAEMPSGSVGRLWPSVFASIDSSTGASTRISAFSGKLTSPGISKTCAASPALVSAAALYSAMRLALADPASRVGMSVVMCSTWALTLAAETALTTASSDMLDLASTTTPLRNPRKIYRARQSPYASYLAPGILRQSSRTVTGSCTHQREVGQIAQVSAKSAEPVCDPLPEPW